MANASISTARSRAIAAVLALAGVLPAVPAAAQGPCGGAYVVGPGDTISGIAARCNSTIPEIVRANAQVSNPDRIDVGWRLTIPEAPGHDAAGFGTPGANAGQPAGQVRAAPATEPRRDVAEASPPADEPGEGVPERLRLEGRVDEGVECPVLRTPDGDVYSLLSESIRFTPGAYVEITGRPVEMSFCMQGTTVEVIELREVPAPSGR